MTGQQLARRTQAPTPPPAPPARRRDWAVPLGIAAGIACLAVALLAWPDGAVPSWLYASAWLLLAAAAATLGAELVRGRR